MARASACRGCSSASKPSTCRQRSSSRATRSSRSPRGARRPSPPATRWPTTPTRTSTRASRRRTRSAPTWSARSRRSTGSAGGAPATRPRRGVRPAGYRAPSAYISPATLPLLEEHGFLYDSSLMADDYTPYRPRIGDTVSAEEPLRRGREARLWELPMCFELDDWPHFQFAFGPPYRAGLSAPSKVLEIWTEEFDWMDRHVDGGLLTVCMHPQVIGRGHRMAMLERFVAHCAAAGARFARMEDVACELE